MHDQCQSFQSRPQFYAAKHLFELATVPAGIKLSNALALCVCSVTQAPNGGVVEVPVWGERESDAPVVGDLRGPRVPVLIYVNLEIM